MVFSNVFLNINIFIGYFEIHKYNEVDFKAFQNIVGALLNIDIHNKSVNTQLQSQVIDYIKNFQKFPQE